MWTELFLHSKWLTIGGEISKTAQLKNLGKVLYQARCKWTDQIRTREAMRA